MDAPVVKFKKRGAKAAPRKAAPPPPKSDSDFSSDSEAEGEDGRVVKRRKTNSNALKASTADQKNKSGLEGTTKYEADRSAVIEASNDATKQSNWYDENADDALSSKNLLGSTRTKPQTFIDKKPDAPTRQVGPQKSSSNVRTITITDYTPDVCKDYKQTGFCGFGDNCKYLHAREDYAAGWKIDREWEMSTKGKKLEGTVVASANRDEKTKDDEGIDFSAGEDTICLLDLQKFVQESDYHQMWTLLLRGMRVETLPNKSHLRCLQREDTWRFQRGEESAEIT
jgi:RING finger protein 113A